jgi:predicted site-specific integrase-resolvase
VVACARICSELQRLLLDKQLDRQAARMSAICAASGWQVVTVAMVVTACGSGINEQRLHVLQLLAEVPGGGSWPTPAAGRAIRQRSGDHLDHLDHLDR